VASFEDLLERWDGERAVIQRDHETGSWIFVCLHSSVLGPSGGGTRMKVYETPAAGLEDALRLSAGMTAKFAVAGLPYVFTGDERRGLFARYGELVESLGGSYFTSSDINTGPADMDVIGEHTEHVFGRTEANGGGGNPAPHTAAGVFHGIRASLAHAYGSDELNGRVVLVQGAGNVGASLASLLREHGARVLAADVDAQRARAVGDDVVEADDVYGIDCDVYAPCALGATLNADTIPRLRCRIVAGSANNQLAQPSDAELLREARILYAPDYVINAGGAIALVGVERAGWSRPELDAALERIGDTLRTIYARADQEEITTAAAADREGRGADQPKSMTLRMPSWASISSKPRLTSSSASLCDTNGSTSMSPAR
jgi:leucine dehydrogenase